MKAKVFGLLDVKLGEYGQLMCAKGDEAFRRGLADALRAAPNAPPNQHPEDYLVYELGEFDNETGVLKGHAVPLLAFPVSSLIPRQE